VVSIQIVGPGQQWNHLSALNVIVASSPAADALFPVTRLYDYASDQIFKFGSLTANPTITADLNRFVNGNLDAWSGGLPTGWGVGISGTATVTQTSVAGEVVTGSAAKLTAGTGQAYIYQQKFFRAGETIRLQTAIRGDGTNNVYIYVRNVQTGRTWNGSAWVANSALTFRSANTYLSQLWDIPLESYLACGCQDLVILSIEIYGTGAAGIGYVDDFFVWSQTGFVGVFGHSADPLIVPEWRSSTDNFGANDVLEATLSPLIPSFYTVKTPASTARYQRIKFVGTNGSGIGVPIYVAEMVLGQPRTLVRNQQDGFKATIAHPQVRSRSAVGALRAFPLARDPSRAYDLDFLYPSLAAYKDARDELVRRARGTYPVVLVPDDADADVAMFGYFEDQWEIARPTKMWRGGLRFVEEPFPAVINT
jgi:hypothetical protein